MRECGRCSGTGVYQAVCASCDGTGTEYGLEARGECTVCGGDGREPVVCWNCDGTGQLAALRVVEESDDPMGVFEDRW